MTTTKAACIAECLLPRDARVPSDLALLNAVSPMALTASALGCSQRWARAGREDAIRNMIADALHTAHRAPAA